jgi:mannose-6-phosphate isomerase-like protein (cupin superfamily)
MTNSGGGDFKKLSAEVAEKIRRGRGELLCDQIRLSRIWTFDTLAEVHMSKVNIAEKFGKISEYWKPYIAAELNGQHVKLDKLLGEFVFHHHENEDEMFLVVKGRFRMEFRDRHEWIEEGEFVVVPRGVEHRPVADEECWIVLFEPASTLNTGNVVNDRTLTELERV